MFLLPFLASLLGNRLSSQNFTSRPLLYTNGANSKRQKMDGSSVYYFLAHIFEKWVCLLPISFTIYWLDIKLTVTWKMTKLLQPGPWIAEWMDHDPVPAPILWLGTTFDYLAREKRGKIILKPTFEKCYVFSKTFHFPENTVRPNTETALFLGWV